MRIAAVLVALLLSSIVGGCLLLGPRTFQVTLPGRGDGLAVAPLPVVLTDSSGLVTAVDVGPELGAPEFVEGVEAMPGRANVLLVGWVGGACDAVVRMTLDGVPSTLRLTIATETRGDACILIGIGRRLGIELRVPVDPANVIIAANP